MSGEEKEGYSSSTVEHSKQDSKPGEELPVASNGDKNIFRDVCSYILVTEFCERLAFYGLVGSLSIFLTRELGISGVQAAELGNTFSAVNYLTPLVGAYLAETHWGRYKTILAFCSIYVVGMGMCTAAAYPTVKSAPLFFIGLFGGVALGSGGIKPNVVVLGADQFNPAIPAEKEQMQSYFNWFYWSINIGAAFSFGFLAYLAVNGMGAVSQDYGFFVSFTIPAVAMGLAIAVFQLGSSKYVKRPPSGSALMTFVGVVVDAAKSSSQGQAMVAGFLLQIPGMVLVIVSFFTPWGVKVFAILGMLCMVTGIILLVITGQSATWLNAARRSNGGNYRDEAVDDASDVVLLAPYFGFLVMFSCVYSQMSGSFILQGCQMDLRVGNGMMSSAQLNLFDCTVILILIPIFDSYIYPALERAGCPVTPLRKIGWGYVVALLAMLVAGIVEIERKRAELLSVHSNCGDVYMSSMSVWWQTPQYILVGIAEILINIAGLDLFYSQAPESMRSVCQAMNLLTQTIGGMVSAGLLSCMSTWFTDNLNDGKLELIFFAFGVLVVVNLMWFVAVAGKYEYREERTHSKTMLEDDKEHEGCVDSAVAPADEAKPLLVEEDNSEEVP